MRPPGRADRSVHELLRPATTTPQQALLATVVSPRRRPLPTPASDLTSGSAVKRSPGGIFVDLCQPSRLFEVGLVQAPFEAMSADALLTPNARAGSVVTHERGSDLLF